MKLTLVTFASLLPLTTAAYAQPRAVVKVNFAVQGATVV